MVPQEPNIFQHGNSIFSKCEFDVYVLRQLSFSRLDIAKRMEA
jgi:hypothetical protein